MKIKFEALTADQIARISDKVETLLSERGVIVKDAGVRDFFAKRGAGVSGDAVRLPKEMLRSSIASVPAQYSLHARNPEKTVTIGIGHDAVINANSGMSFIQDMDGTRRPASVEDQILMLKLNHTSEVAGVTNAGILYPTVGIDVKDAKYVQMINALTYSDKPFFCQGANESFGRAAIALARIATGYNDRPVCMSVVNSLSPLLWDTDMLGMIRLFAEENQPINISSSAMAGVTAPLNLTSAIITSCAEGLFGVAYSQLVRPGAPVVFGCFPGVMDMRNMSMSYGAPEFSIMCAAASQMASYYHLPFRGGGALTSAKAIGADSGAESALGMMTALCCDVHYMHQSIGTLDSILACSAEKFVMDEDIVARVRRMQKGVGEIDENLLEEIDEGLEERCFLGLESTVSNFREIIYQPVFANGRNYADWSKEKKSSEISAHEIVEERINAYREPDIGTELKKQMRGYVAKLGVDPAKLGA